MRSGHLCRSLSHGFDLDLQVHALADHQSAGFERLVPRETEVLGRAEEPVCWTLTGFASGYLSRAYGRGIYCREERCRGKGDAVCRLVGRPLEEWGDAFAPDLPFYQKACLDAALAQVTDELKRVEKRLRRQRQALGSAATIGTKVSGLVVQSEAMQHVLDLARRVAQVDSTVLITGESGVGNGWPGNVRELENTIARATVLATRSRIDADDLPQEVSLAVPDTFVPGEAKDARGGFRGRAGRTPRRCRRPERRREDLARAHW